MPDPVQRIPNVPPSDWTPEVRDVFTVMEGVHAATNGSVSNAILALANHPPLAMAFLTLHMRFLPLLRATPRLRELVILRVAWLRQCQYEWGHHCAQAGQHGLTAAHCEALKTGPEHPIWSDVERLLLRALDEFSDAARLSDETWSALTAQFSRDQVMELIFLASQYEMVCRAFNAMRIQIEAPFWNPALPPA